MIKKVIFIISSVSLMGCVSAPSLPPEMPIPKYEITDKVDHKITEESLEIIANRFYAYKSNTFTGTSEGSLVLDLIKRANYVEKTSKDLSNEILYDCKIFKLWGIPSEKYFHRMFVISDSSEKKLNSLSVGLDYENVNKIKFINDRIDIYKKDKSEGLITIGEMDGLKTKSMIVYRCFVTKNSIFTR
jgi:hypothetical protein